MNSVVWSQQGMILHVVVLHHSRQIALQAHEASTRMEAVGVTEN